MAECDHNCAGCQQEGSCEQKSLLAPLNVNSSINKVIGVVSGKGGVGKSMVTSLLAVALARQGYRVGILDADITGPSIPKIFGVSEQASMANNEIYPQVSRGGVSIISVNLLLENADDPVVWRGPIPSGVVRQFWSDVVWTKLDYLLVDMPPGTGDVPLTVFQSLPLDGVIVVTAPQQLVSMIVGKAVKMARLMEIPILGLVENMSSFRCPDCGKVHAIFGESHIEEIAKKYEIEKIVRLPIDPRISEAGDNGKIEGYLIPEQDQLVELAPELDPE